MTTYFINEIFLTLQGEGYWTGRPAVFCRFSRCNLWTGREKDRANAICKFCDTDFLKGDKYELDDLIAHIVDIAAGCRFIVLTGGEPTLQVDQPLIAALHDCGFYIAIETNGTRPVPTGIDWVCVSPKAEAILKVYRGNELKLVYPQEGGPPERYADFDFEHFWLSPMNSPYGELDADNTKLAIEYCLAHPRWRLNTQIHKVVGIS